MRLLVEASIARWFHVVAVVPVFFISQVSVKVIRRCRSSRSMRKVLVCPCPLFLCNLVFVMGPSSVVPSLQLLSLITVDASSVVVLDVVVGVVNGNVMEVSVVDSVI